MAPKRSKLRIAGLGCAGLIVILALGLCIFMFVSANRLNSQMASMNKQGKLLTVHDIMNEQVPPNENAAPIFTQVMNEINQLRGGGSQYNKFSASGVMDKFIIRDVRKADPELWNKVRPAIKQSENVVSLLEEASKKPKCKFPVDWKAGPAATFPHLGYLRESSRILSAHTILAAKDGDMGRATDLLDINFKTARTLPNEPILISHLVMVAMTTIASDSLKQTAEIGDINEAQAKRLYDTLGTIDPKKSYRRSMEGERAMGLALFAQVRRDPGGTALQMTTSGSASTVVKEAAGYAYRPVSYLDQSAYLKAMQKNIDSANYTYREIQRKDLVSDPDKLPKYAIVSRIMSPVFIRAASARDKAIVEVQGSRIFLALLAYKDRFGSYPANLSELKKLGWKLDTTDIFSGKDFNYKRQGKGFTLYSIGQNLSDDGGLSSGRSSTTGPGADDMVWKMER